MKNQETIISKTDGFALFTIRDDKGRYIATFHVSNGMPDETVVFFGKHSPCKVEIELIQNEVKPESEPA